MIAFGGLLVPGMAHPFPPHVLLPLTFCAPFLTSSLFPPTPNHKLAFSHPVHTCMYLRVRASMVKKLNSHVTHVSHGKPAPNSTLSNCPLPLVHPLPHLAVCLAFWLVGLDKPPDAGYDWSAPDAPIHARQRRSPSALVGEF